MRHRGREPPDRVKVKNRKHPAMVRAEEIDS
jgi:hypothetical protein